MILRNRRAFRRIRGINPRNPRDSHLNPRDSHLFSLSSIPFGPTFGVAQPFNSSRPRQTCRAFRNHQLSRGSFIQYHEMGRGKQGKSGETRFEIPSTKLQIPNKHEGPNPREPGKSQIPSTKFQTNAKPKAQDSKRALRRATAFRSLRFGA